MGSLNRVMLIGNLGADPELKYTPSGKAVCNLSIATNEVWKDKEGNKQEKVEWHRVNLWGDLAENCAKYLAKGRSVYVEGKLQTRSWEDKDGQKKYATEIVASSVIFLGGGDGEKKPWGEKQGNSNQGGARTADDIPVDDDVPF